MVPGEIRPAALIKTGGKTGGQIGRSPSTALPLKRDTRVGENQNSGHGPNSNKLTLLGGKRYNIRIARGDLF